LSFHSSIKQTKQYQKQIYQNQLALGFQKENIPINQKMKKEYRYNQTIYTIVQAKLLLFSSVFFAVGETPNFI
jgi:hypothetical protein